MYNSDIDLYIYVQTAQIWSFWTHQIVQLTTPFVQYVTKSKPHGPLISQTSSQIFYKKTLCDFANLCDDSLEFNKCKGGDLVSKKVLESGVGTAWEVAR